MLSLIKKEDCCGCAACMQACPRQCIKMTFDEEGFQYPKVNVTNCVNCGLCEKCARFGRNGINKNWMHRKFILHMQKMMKFVYIVHQEEFLHYCLKAV